MLLFSVRKISTSHSTHSSTLRSYEFQRLASFVKESYWSILLNIIQPVNCCCIYSLFLSNDKFELLHWASFVLFASMMIDLYFILYIINDIYFIRTTVTINKAVSCQCNGNNITQLLLLSLTCTMRHETLPWFPANYINTLWVAFDSLVQLLESICDPFHFLWCKKCSSSSVSTMRTSNIHFNRFATVDTSSVNLHPGENPFEKPTKGTGVLPVELSDNLHACSIGILSLRKNIDIMLHQYRSISFKTYITKKG